MVLFVLTRNANFFSGITSVSVLVVGQNRKLRRLKLTVRVPWRSGPSAFINRHCGLHSGIRLKSEISAHTFGTGALISICACNNGSATAFSFWVHGDNGVEFSSIRSAH